jgi:hypothetical protein
VNAAIIADTYGTCGAAAGADFETLDSCAQTFKKDIVTASAAAACGKESGQWRACRVHVSSRSDLLHHGRVGEHAGAACSWPGRQCILCVQATLDRVRVAPPLRIHTDTVVGYRGTGSLSYQSALTAVFLAVS